MTLCIAATCIHEGKAAIVLCSDWRAESGDLAGGDVEDKLTWIIPKAWAALKAGVISDADKLASAYRSVFQASTLPLSASGILPTMTSGFQQYRLMLINDYLTTTLGIDYRSLIAGIRASEDPTAPLIEFPEEFIEKKLDAVEQVPFTNCQLILAGYDDCGIPVICVVNEPPTDTLTYSRVRIESNFCAIGSGAAVALMSLYRREHIGSDIELMRAAYHVYEAKLLGEVSPGVGDATSITILFPNGECWDLSSAGHKYMTERFEYFGPMPIGKRKRKPLLAPYFKLDAKYFEQYQGTWGKQAQPSKPINSEIVQT